MQTLNTFRFLLPLLFAFGAGARAQEITLSTPAAGVSADSEISVDLVVMNSGAAALTYLPQAELKATLSQGSRSWPVVLALAPAGAEAEVGPGAYRRFPYLVRLPAEVADTLILRLDSDPSLRAVVDVGTPVATRGAVASAESPVLAPAGPRRGLVPQPAASKIERTFRERFGTHESIYFLYGPEDPAVKFQLSFKYRLFGDAGMENTTGHRSSLQFGYTQRSLWDVEAESSPFLDTSYMPEIFFEHLAPDPGEEEGAFTWLGLQSGYKHESNGRDGDRSRSMNTAFLSTAVAFGELDGWRMVVEPRVFTYLSDLSDNPDMKKYRGYGELRLLFGRNDGAELLLTGRVGSAWDHATVQADLTFPIRWRLGDFASYFLVQYFYGYGESLIQYNEKSESVRAGFSFVR